MSLDQARQLRELDDERLTKLIAKHWGRVQITTPLEKQGRITAVSIILARGTGDAARGREHFEKVCANCHKLHGKGLTIGRVLSGLLAESNADTITLLDAKTNGRCSIEKIWMSFKNRPSR